MIEDEPDIAIPGVFGELLLHAGASFAAAATMTVAVYKFPPGLFANARIRANAHYDATHPQVKTKRRTGTVVAATHSKLQVRVLWDGCRSHQSVDLRFFELEGESHAS